MFLKWSVIQWAFSRIQKIIHLLKYIWYFMHLLLTKRIFRIDCSERMRSFLHFPTLRIYSLPERIFFSALRKKDYSLGAKTKNTGNLWLHKLLNTSHVWSLESLRCTVLAYIDSFFLSVAFFATDSSLI